MCGFVNYRVVTEFSPEVPDPDSYRDRISPKAFFEVIEVSSLHLIKPQILDDIMIYFKAGYLAVFVPVKSRPFIQSILLIRRAWL
jgi:hypothetical protein